MPKVTFIFADGKGRDIQAKTGQTLLQVAQQNGIDEIEGACGGEMACATCHVIVDPEWYGQLPPPVHDETDMLDLASGLTRTSRLGCQIRLTEALNGLKVKLPPNLKGLLG
jgi:2Fe-2S ferredoxin